RTSNGIFVSQVLKTRKKENHWLAPLRLNNGELENYIKQNDAIWFKKISFTTDE
ncbi:unnamed protein product, partial [Heterotrigona itama]